MFGQKHIYRFELFSQLYLSTVFDIVTKMWKERSIKHENGKLMAKQVNISQLKQKQKMWNRWPHTEVPQVINVISISTTTGHFHGKLDSRLRKPYMHSNRTPNINNQHNHWHYKQSTQVCSGLSEHMKTTRNPYTERFTT